jgi:hypothetical protein
MAVLVLLLELAILYPTGLQAPGKAGPAVGLRGAYSIDDAASDDINKAIEATVAKVNFILRPVARGRLRATNAQYRKVEISSNEKEVSIVFDQLEAIKSPIDGTFVNWTREDGEKLRVNITFKNGKLVQSLKAADGQRVNTFSLSAQGDKMTIQVVVTSPRIPEPLNYSLVYKRL